MYLLVVFFIVGATALPVPSAPAHLERYSPLMITAPESMLRRNVVAAFLVPADVTPRTFNPSDPEFLHYLQKQHMNIENNEFFTFSKPEIEVKPRPEYDPLFSSGSGTFTLDDKELTVVKKPLKPCTPEDEIRPVEMPEPEEEKLPEPTEIEEMSEPDEDKSPEPIDLEEMSEIEEHISLELIEPEEMSEPEEDKSPKPMEPEEMSEPEEDNPPEPIEPEEMSEPEDEKSSEPIEPEEISEPEKKPSEPIKQEELSIAAGEEKPLEPEKLTMPAELEPSKTEEKDKAEIEATNEKKPLAPEILLPPPMPLPPVSKPVMKPRPPIFSFKPPFFSFFYPNRYSGKLSLSSLPLVSNLNLQSLPNLPSTNLGGSLSSLSLPSLSGLKPSWLTLPSFQLPSLPILNDRDHILVKPGPGNVVVETVEKKDEK